ncbi:MAG TPA: hypothetical protein VLI05_00240 [Candidatus Saccharimonadia bacterium]|nr:hypothetical protein [Candidatus Saccharimonadia bacterium]
MPKTIHFVLGLIAASGAAVLLSGSALADATLPAPLSSFNAGNDRPGLNLDANSLGTYGPQVGPMAAQDEPGTVAADPGAESLTPLVNVNLSTTASSAAPGDDSTIGGPPAGTDTPDGPGGGNSLTLGDNISLVAGLNSDNPDAPTGLALRSDDDQPVASSGLPAVVPPEAGSHNAVSMVPYHSSWLAIQPTITAHPELPLGLTLGLAAPSPNHNKTPASPSGLLGTLTAELAGAVVPVYWLLLGPLGGVRRFSLSLAEAGRLVSLLGVVSTTYGLWLRRTGYAHAARSDMAASFFATSHLESYVQTLRLRYSSLFMTSDSKTTHYITTNNCRKEAIV